MSNGYGGAAPPTAAPAAHDAGYVPAAEARRALERVLSHPRLRASPRISAFLRHVAEESLAGRSSRLRQADIARAVLERQDLDPTFEPAVRVLAGRARRALQRHYEGPGDQDPVRISIPKGSFAPVFRRVTPSAGSARHAPEALALPVIAVAGVDARLARPAVATALPDAIVLALSRAPDCRAVGPSGPAPDTAASCRALARRLRADQVLGMRVLEHPEGPRVEAWLADAASGCPWWRWSATMPRTGEGPFAAADALAARIALAVAGQGGVIHSVAPARGAEDPVVSVALHRFHRAKLLDDIPGLSTTIAALEQAARTRPGDALVLASLAEAYRLNATWWLGASPYGHEHAAELALRATTMDPRSPAAASALLNASTGAGAPVGLVEARAGRLMDLVGETAEALSLAGVVMTIASGWEHGPALVRRGLALVPTGDGRPRAVFAVERLMAGDDVGVLAEHDRMDPPPVFLMPLLRAVALARLGHTQEAVSEVDRARRMDRRVDWDRDEVLRGAMLPEPAVRVMSETLRRLDRTRAHTSSPAAGGAPRR